MKDGSFVEIPQSPSSVSRYLSFDTESATSALLAGSPYFSLPVFGLDEFSHVPVIDLNDVGPIVIVGPSVRSFTFWPMNSSKLQYAEAIADPSAKVEYHADGQKSVMHPSDLPELLVRQNCAVDLSLLRVKRVSDFVTEIYTPAEWTWPSKQSVPGNGGCKWGSAPAPMIEMQVNGQGYHAFRPSTADSANLGATTTKDSVSAEDLQQLLIRVGSLYGKAETSNGERFNASFQFSPDGAAYFSLIDYSGEQPSEVCLGDLRVRSQASKEVSFDVSLFPPSHEACAGVSTINLFQSLDRKEVFLAEFVTQDSSQTGILPTLAVLSYITDENPYDSEINLLLSDLREPLVLDPEEFPILGGGE